MDPTTPNPDPSQPPADNNHGQLSPGGRRIKRRLMYSLIGVYCLSLAAAGIMILRGQAGPEAGRKGVDQAKGILAMAEKDSVGWVAIHGPIYNSEGGKPWEKGVEQWVRRIRSVAEAKGVKAIVLDINSPGGSVGAVQELYSQIQRVKKEKNIPFVALFDDVSASGGYYIASACDRIVAHPGTLTGSIGVIFSVSNMEGLFNKIGYKVDPIKSGKLKDIGSPARPMTKEERDLLQALINDAYGQFLTAVATGRNLPEDQVRPLADGRIFSGSQALQAKLVDKLGDSTDAVELAAQLGHISGKPRIKRDTERISDIFDMLDSRFEGALTGAPSWLEGLKPRTYTGLEYRWSGG